MNKNSAKNLALALLVLVLLIVGGVLLFTTNQAQAIQNFADCASAGYPVMESYPRQCRAPDGRLFVEQIDGESFSSVVSSSTQSSIMADEPCIISQSQNIRVFEPCPNQEIGMPVRIRGDARVFEAAFSYRILDEDGTVLIEGHDMANALDVGLFGPFDLSVGYPKPKGKTGIVEVFSYSAKDGSQIDTASVPIRFKAGVDSMAVNVFFSNTADDPDMLACSRVEPVKRYVARDAQPARHALEELIRGPTIREKSLGFISSIPEGVVVQKLTIQNGVASVDFNSAIEAGGSCRVVAIRSQVEHTLGQFPTVQSVVISVNGNEEEALQP